MIPTDMRDLRFERDVTRLSALEPRALAEAFFEIGARTGHMTTIEEVVARYAHIDRGTLGAVGGDRFAPRPNLCLVGGRGHG
jgi:hypothetical protein